MTALFGEFGIIMMIAGGTAVVMQWLGFSRGQVVFFGLAGVGVVLNFHTNYHCDRDMFGAFVSAYRDGDNCNGALTVVSITTVVITTAAVIGGTALAASLAVMLTKRAWRFATEDIPEWRRRRAAAIAMRRIAREQRRAERQAERAARRAARASRPRRVWVCTLRALIAGAVAGGVVLGTPFTTPPPEYVLTAADRAQHEFACTTEDGEPGITFADRCWPLDTTEIGKYNTPSDIPYSTRREITDARPLAGLTGLRVLWLSNTQVSDVGPLSGLTGLRELWLYNTRVSDVGPLAGLTGLRELNLRDTRVIDVGPLAGLTGLRVLYLRYTEVRDVGPLSGLTGLRVLSLYGTRVSDVGPLSGLTGLQVASLISTQVRDLSPFSRLPALRELYLGGTPVRDLSPLASVATLSRLGTPDGAYHGSWTNDTPESRAAVQEAIRTWRPRED